MFKNYIITLFSLFYLCGLEAQENLNLILPSKHSKSIEDIFPDPQKRFIISYSESQLKIYDYRSVKQLFSISDFKGKISTIKISANGKYLAFSSNLNYLYRVCLDKDNTIIQLDSLSSNRAFQWDSKDDILYYISFENKFIQKKVADNIDIKTNDLGNIISNNNILGLEIKKDAENIISIQTNGVYEINLNEGNIKELKKTDFDFIVSYALSADKEQIALAYNSGLIEIVNLQSKGIIPINNKYLKNKTHHHLWFSPNNKFLISSSTEFKDFKKGKNELHSIPLDEPKKMRSLEFFKGINEIDFSKKEDYIFISSDEKTSGFSVLEFSLLELKSTAVISEFYEEITAICIKTDCNSMLYGDYNGYLYEMPFDTKSLSRKIDDELETFWHIDISPDSKEWVYTFDKGTVSFNNSKNGLESRTLTINKEHLGKIRYSPDGKYLLVESLDGTIYLYKLDSLQKVMEISNYVPSESTLNKVGKSINTNYTVALYNISDIKFDKDGNYFAVAYGRQLDVFDAKSFKISNTFYFDKDINSICFHPIKNEIYVSTDSISILNYTNGKMLGGFAKENKYSVAVHKIDIGKGAKLIAFPTKFNEEISIYNIETKSKIVAVNREESLLPLSFKIDPFEQRLLYTKAKNKISIFEIESTKEQLLETAHCEKIHDIVFSTDGRLMISYSSDMVIFWDYASLKPIYQRISFKNNNWLVKLAESPYYMCSKEAAKMLHYVNLDLKAIGFEQLDPVYNRPDIVLEKLGKYFGDNNSEMVNHYKAEWEKRMRRLGLNNAKVFNEQITVPMAEIVGDEEFSYDTPEGVFDFVISAKDPKFKLISYNVIVNEVPFYGSMGISISEFNKSNFEKNVSVPLSIGENKIQVSVMNELGLENFKYPTYINYKPEKKGIPARTHFIGIGVNKFKDSQYNLNFCVKDIEDLSKEFGEINSKIQLLKDEQVTRENILLLKKYLNDSTTVNDLVIISCSSHGLLDDSLNFYLAMHDTDFDYPLEKSLKYEELENLLDGIPARKKLLLLDACNSGENDKDNILIKSKDEKSIAARGPKKKVLSKSSFQTMNELFVNVRNNTGSVIISAAGGVQSALEGDAVQLNGKTLENGAFTYALLEMLRQSKAEKKKLSVKNLKKYVEKRVIEITNGKQTPTSRQETMEIDWNIW